MVQQRFEPRRKHRQREAGRAACQHDLVAGLADLHRHGFFIDSAVEQMHRSLQPAGKGVAPAIDLRGCGERVKMPELYHPARAGLVDYDKGGIRIAGMAFIHLQRDDRGAKCHEPGSAVRWRLGHEITVKFRFDKAGGQVPAAEGPILQNRRQELAVAGDAVDLVMIKRQMQPVDGRLAGWRMRHKLGDHRVVIHRDFAALIDAGIHPHAFTRGLAIAQQLTDGGKEAAGRVLGIDAGLDSPAIRDDVILRQAELLAGGDADHLLDKVEAIDHFCHRMFHLETGVHLKEVEILVGTDDEFDRAGGPVADGARQLNGLPAHGGACLG